jgi:hypothetical protein
MMKLPAWGLAFVFAGWLISSAIAGSVWITEMKSISGKWEGTVTCPRCPVGNYSLIINEDGSWISKGPDIGTNGVGTLANGQFHFKSYTTGKSGTWTLTDTGGQRVLISLTDDQTIRGEFRRTK